VALGDLLLVVALLAQSELPKRQHDDKLAKSSSLGDTVCGAERSWEVGWCVEGGWGGRGLCGRGCVEGQEVVGVWVGGGGAGVGAGGWVCGLGGVGGWCGRCGESERARRGQVCRACGWRPRAFSGGGRRICAAVRRGVSRLWSATTRGCSRPRARWALDQPADQWPVRCRGSPARRRRPRRWYPGPAHSSWPLRPWLSRASPIRAAAAGVERAGEQSL
jgi:hypothetical protein